MRARSKNLLSLLFLAGERVHEVALRHGSLSERPLGTSRRRWRALEVLADDCKQFGPFFGEQLEITKQLVRTAAGVASFSALYYAVASAVDSTYRDEYVERLTQQLQDTFRERAEYLELLKARDARVSSGVG